MNFSLPALNLPACNFRIADNGQSKQIFDCIRRKYVALTPEEWVRQHLIIYLTEHCGFPLSLIAVEKQVKLNGMAKRFDLMIYDNEGKPMLVAECKSPDLKLNQKSFDQVSRYCLATGLNHFIVTNGLEHFVANIDHDNQRFQFHEEFPMYSQVKNK